MRPTRKLPYRLFRPTDALLPLAFLLAALLGRGNLAFELFLAWYGVKLCALATADGLRTAFAAQPSGRYAQGSALIALLMQCAGAGIAMALGRHFHPVPMLLPLVGCGLLLNIEHVLYEYLFAVGDPGSAQLCRCITSGLMLAGMLLCAPREVTSPDSEGWNMLWPIIASGASVLVGLAVSLCVGGRLRPRLNPEPLRRAPLALLQTALFPALWLGIAHFTGFGGATALPLYAGLAVYAACRVPFRRAPREAAPMNWTLLIVALFAVLAGAPVLAGWISYDYPLFREIPYVCMAIVLGCACGFGMYGNIAKNSNE